MNRPCAFHYQRAGPGPGAGVRGFGDMLIMALFGAIGDGVAEDPRRVMSTPRHRLACAAAGGGRTRRLSRSAPLGRRHRPRHDQRRRRAWCRSLARGRTPTLVAATGAVWGVPSGAAASACAARSRNVVPDGRPVDVDGAKADAAWRSPSVGVDRRDHGAGPLMRCPGQSRSGRRWEWTRPRSSWPDLGARRCTRPPWFPVGVNATCRVPWSASAFILAAAAVIAVCAAVMRRGDRLRRASQPLLAVAATGDHWAGVTS